MKEAWEVHCEDPLRQTWITYNGTTVGHLSRYEVVYDREGRPMLRMEVAAPCVKLIVDLLK